VTDHGAMAGGGAAGATMSSVNGSDHPGARPPAESAADVAAEADLRAALDRLRAWFRGQSSVVVAFSGGADSAFVAWVATDVLGPERAHCATAVSPSLPESELHGCAELATAWGLNWSKVVTDELDDPAYRRNDAQRCFHCKDALSRALRPLAEAEGATVVLGVNVDDLGDHRPGQRAAVSHGARFPLVDAGFTKVMVRAASRLLGLPTADKPAAACLASRVPYGTPVTLGVLREVEAAEAGLRRLGFTDLRVRHYGETARLEVPVDRLGDVVDRRAAVVAAVHAAGYRYVTVDLEGLRSGNLNGAAGGPLAGDPGRGR
jgi:uncharacterized protein